MLRFLFLIGASIFAYGTLLFNLYDLQVVKGDNYLVRAGSDVVALRYLRANRGAIYFTDKEGNFLPAVLNKNFPLVYAVPSAIEDASEAANVLAPILGRDVEELERIFSKKDDLYEPLLRKADRELAGKISSLAIKGIYADAEPGRFYPLGPLASQILGFVGPNSGDAGDAGKYGLELFYEELLRGKHGEISDGRIIRPTPGNDLVLTIDPNIQIEAEKILENLVEKYDADGGNVIVMEPKTGKILAMGSRPNFDPNNYGKSPLSSFLNPTIQQIYEPGSVFKVMTMATGIDSGKITPDTVYYDTGRLTLNGRTIENADLKKHGPYGRATMTNVIEHSINTGAVFAQKQIGRELFTEYVNRFGFGEMAGVDLPGELAGDTRRLSPKERDIAFATASYGQGIAVTPLEMINAFAAIANGGVLMRPYLNAELEPEVIRRVIAPDAAWQVTEMIISAVDKAGVASIKGYKVAGKTGTAFIPDFKHGGYTENVINTYVGFAPASRPRFVALIKLNNPAGAPYAALTVVPAFRDLAQFILNYYGVEPDRL